jgi:hypothetical protein
LLAAAAGEDVGPDVGRDLRAGAERAGRTGDTYGWALNEPLLVRLLLGADCLACFGV